jgi:uncharacterized membrane protein YbhN (UPF0104 family)
LLGRLGEVARALQSQIGVKLTIWKQIGWNKVGIGLSATIILVSGLLLAHRLRDLDWRAVAAAVAAVSPAHVAGAAFFVACGYVTLALYDWFALRTIGARQVPLRIAALAGATSYAIGHGLGAMMLASAAIRFRIYSRWGLSLIDIAKICFIAGLTQPGDRHCGVERAVGLLDLGLEQDARAGPQSSSVTLPSGAMTLLQIGIGLADLSCCSLVMYLLMPSLPAIDFMPLAVIVVFGTLLGFASHAPGAIGALDAAMLIGLPTFDRAELVTTLLLYRLLYFVAPFALALAGLGLREAHIHFRQ